MEHHTSNHDAQAGFDHDSSKQRLYNPYKDLQLPYRNFQLSTSPEFLFAEEASRQRRSWSENLTFYTGCGYLAGAVGGASAGFVSGVKSFESGDTTKLRINRILNSSGHSGRVWGNRLGVIGLLYAGIESGVVVARDTDDVWNSVAAGLGTGAVYRAARGVRSAAVAGAVGGILVGMAVTAKQALKRKPEIEIALPFVFLSCFLVSAKDVTREYKGSLALTRLMQMPGLRAPWTARHCHHGARKEDSKNDWIPYLLGMKVLNLAKIVQSTRPIKEQILSNGKQKLRY